MERDFSKSVATVFETAPETIKPRDKNIRKQLCCLSSFLKILLFFSKLHRFQYTPKDVKFED